MKNTGVILVLILSTSSLPLPDVTSNTDSLKLNNFTNEYYAFTSGSPKRIDNYIHFIKDNMMDDISVILEGGGGISAEKPLTLTLIDPIGNILEKIEYTQFGNHEFTISSSEVMGEYLIQVSVASADPQTFHAECCVDIIYSIQYSGLKVPPYIEGQSDTFLFSPGNQFTPIPVFGGNFVFGAYFEANEKYIFEVNGFGLRNVISEINLYKENIGNIPPISYDDASIFEKYEFEVFESNYYRIDITTRNDDGDGRWILGIRLVNEVDDSIIPLINGNCESGCDSDFDLLEDDIEKTLQLNPYDRDTDGDLVGDGIEVIFDADPTKRKNSPFSYTITNSTTQSLTNIELEVQFNHKYLESLLRLDYRARQNGIEYSNQYSFTREEIEVLKDITLTFAANMTTDSSPRIFVTYYFDDGTIYGESFELEEVSKSLFSAAEEFINKYNEQIKWSFGILSIAIILVIYFIKSRKAKIRRIFSSLYPEKP